MLLLVSLLACLPRPSLAPVQVAAEALPPDHLRLVFLGDSGYLPGGIPCTWREDGSATERCHVQADQLERLKAAIRAEDADAVYGLGDLVYPVGPRCRQPEGAVAEELDAKVGAVYGDLGAPSWLVLGNHDVGQLGRAPRRERCLLAWAEQTEGIVMPGLQYVVDHGLATVVVADTNLRRRKKLPGAALEAALAGDDWVIVAAHHELHTAFEKLDQHPLEPPGSGEWLSDLDLAPHLWVNGHAHTLQLGLYDARVVDDGRVDRDDPAEPLLIPAVTSGAVSKLRAHPSCGLDGVTEPECTVDDPRGMPVFSYSRFAFAVVDMDAETMTVRFVDLDGRALFSWTRSKADPGPL